MEYSKSYIKQLEMLTAKTPAERFSMMVDLIEGQLDVMRAGIRFQNPKFNNEEIEKCLKQRIRQSYGNIGNKGKV